MLGLIAVYFNIEWNRKYSFVCSQFVAYTMDKIGIKLEKPFCLYTPDDFRSFPGATLVYSGELNSFYFDMKDQRRYVSVRRYSPKA